MESEWNGPRWLPIRWQRQRAVFLLALHARLLALSFASNQNECSNFIVKAQMSGFLDSSDDLRDLHGHMNPAYLSPALAGDLV